MSAPARRGSRDDLAWAGALALEKPLDAFVNPNRTSGGWLSAEQVASYHELGYLTVESVFSPAEVAELRRATDEFVEASRAVTEPTDIFDLEPSHTPAEPAVRRVNNPVANSEVYHRAFCHDAVLGMVEQLLGPHIRTNGDKLNMKLPGLGSPVQWHQVPPPQLYPPTPGAPPAFSRSPLPVAGLELLPPHQRRPAGCGRGDR